MDRSDKIYISTKGGPIHPEYHGFQPDLAFARAGPVEILKSAKLKYALTTYAAENLIQKYLFPSRTDFYIDPKDKEKWHSILSQEGLVGKGNTRMLIGDTHVFYNLSEKDGLKTVSIPQLVVDLLRGGWGGPCAEAAEMLIEKEEEQIVSRK